MHRRAHMAKDLRNVTPRFASAARSLIAPVLIVLAASCGAEERSTGPAPVADVPVAAWRELGEMNRRLGDRDKALTAYRAYLAHAPNADDAWLAQDAIKTLEGSAS